MDGNLADVVVLDLSAVGPGSRCTAILRDLGATVVKVWAPAAHSRIEPPFYAYGAHRGMKRARIDLRVSDGRAAFVRLSEGADVIVESYRPGVAARLGITYDDLVRANERIVYASLSGYGQTGPYAAWAGHDLNYLGVGGFLATQGIREDGGPAIPGATIADGAGGGWQAALAICAALVGRAASGRGQYLDVSTTEGVLALSSLNVDEYLATGAHPQPGATLLTGGYACYDVYRCRDGRWLTVAAIEPKFFANLCEALGCAELAPLQMDLERQDEIRAALTRAFSSKDRDEWVRTLAPADACVAPVLSISEVARNEHLEARGAFADAHHPERGRFRQVAAVVAGASRDSSPAQVSDATHTRELLHGAGFGETEIDALERDGVIE